MENSQRVWARHTSNCTQTQDNTLSALWLPQLNLYSNWSVTVCPHVCDYNSPPCPSSWVWQIQIGSNNILHCWESEWQHLWPQLTYSQKSRTDGALKVCGVLCLCAVIRSYKVYLVYAVPPVSWQRSRLVVWKVCKTELVEWFILICGTLLWRKRWSIPRNMNRRNCNNAYDSCD